MKAQIIAIPVDYTNSRKVAEAIESRQFDSYVELHKQLHKQLQFENAIPEPTIYSLTDFMDACNDQEIDLEGNFISYVYITK